MLPARPNRPTQLWFDGYCRYALRKHFHRVMRYGDVPFDPGRPTVYVANHSAFWDALAVNHLIHATRRQRAYCMADAAEVRRHPFFRRVGAFGVDRASRLDGGRAIRYAVDLLAGPPCALVLFPQGMIRPNDERPLAVEPGVGRVLVAAGDRGVRPAVVCVALRYDFWLDQRPELQVDLSTPADTTVDGLRRQLESRVDALAAAGRRYEPGTVLLEGRRSISRWGERLPRGAGVKRSRGIDDFKEPRPK